MDIPSPVAGTVTEVRIAVGDQVSQGSLVAKVETSDLVSEAETPNAAVLEEASPRKDLESESGHDLPVSEHPNSTPPVVPRPPPSLPPTIESDVEPLPHASPAVRRFARELGADLSKLNGTGAYGRILKEDVTAFIKSMRGSDPDASVYWMMRMLDAGEDPRFVTRRMIIFASEDVGVADPRALTLAVEHHDELGGRVDRRHRDVGEFAGRHRQFAAPGRGGEVNALVVLIPIALGLGAAGLAAFFWSMRDGQYDDMDGAAVRILIEDEDED